MKEQWRSIPGFPAYSVSNKGQVASHLKKTGQHKWIIDKSQYKILKPSYNPYASITLHKNNKGYRRRIAQLVLLAFVGECPPKMEVCHNNGNPTNDYLENLRYDTHKANAKDTSKHCNGKWPYRNRKFSENQVIELRNRAASGEQLKDLAIEFGIHPSNVSHITTGRIYKWAGGPITKSKTNKHIIKNIREERSNGASLKFLANKYKMSISGISRIALGSRHKDIEGPIIEKPWSVIIR